MAIFVSRCALAIPGFMENYIKKGKMMQKTIFLYTTLIGWAILLASCSRQMPLSSTQPTPSTVQVSGAMYRVMHQGELGATIQLDSIANKTQLYGLGPLAYLRGELLLLDGHSYVSVVSPDGQGMEVREDFAVGAPFFVYDRIEAWEEQTLPDSVVTLSQLEHHLNNISKHRPRPFCFKVLGPVEEARIHIVNLPEGSRVSSPEEAHRGQKNYHLTHLDAELVGFFSTEHQAVFTHHDTYLHIHLITPDRLIMGHLDYLSLKPGRARLFLPR